MIRTTLYAFICISLAVGGCDCRVDRPLDASTDAARDTFDGSSDAMDASPDSLDASADASLDTSVPDTSMAPVLVEVPPPDEAMIGERVRTISITVRTADASFAGTDSPQEVCFGEAGCFALEEEDPHDIIDGTDFRRDKVNVFHFEDLDLPRSSLSDVTLGTSSPPDEDNDRWAPACLEVRLDGVPAYCNDELPFIGTGDSSGETRSFTDTRGFHEACVTCQRGTLTHGPMIGAPERDALRVWARTDASRLVGLRMSENADLSDSAMVAWGVPRPEDDFTVTLEVSGLPSATTFYYRVEVDGSIDEPIREITTAPTDGDTAPFRFAFGSCARQEEQPIFAKVAAERPDLFLHVGDNHYANSPYTGVHRHFYRRNRDSPERSALMATTPSLATWDDHDFLANNSNGECEGIDDARRAFSEYWANPSAGEDGEGVYFKQRYGAAEFFMLDCRTFRPDTRDSGNRCVPKSTPPTLRREDGLLGPQQTGWLLEGLSASTATFKFIACGSRFTPLGSADSWRAFPDARDAFFSELDRREIEGVVLLSGDIHRTQLRTIRRDVGYDLPELTSSPLAYAPPTFCTSTDEAGRRACLSDRSFITVDVDPAREDPLLVVRVIDSEGDEFATWTLAASDLR